MTTKTLTLDPIYPDGTPAIGTRLSVSVDRDVAIIGSGVVARKSAVRSYTVGRDGVFPTIGVVPNDDASLQDRSKGYGIIVEAERTPNGGITGGPWTYSINSADPDAVSLSTLDPAVLSPVPNAQVSPAQISAAVTDSQTAITDSADAKSSAAAAQADAAQSATDAANAAALVGAPADNVTATAVSNAGTQTRAALDALYLGLDTFSTVYVESARKPGDNDNQAWARALSAAVTLGAQAVQGTASQYQFAAPVDVGGASGLTIRGNSSIRTVISAASGVNLNSAFATSEGSASVSDITFENLYFNGGMTSEPNGKARDSGSGANQRPYGTTQMATGINIAGNLVPGWETSMPTVTNIRIKDCTFYGTAGLPVFITGVRGWVQMTGCIVRRCMDSGFTFNESVTFSSNRVIYSADNGCSLSRGNTDVAVIGNIITDPWYYGIWLGGFQQSAGAGGTIPATPGPQRVSVTGNVVHNSGRGGIYAGGAPQSATISGNTVDTVTRGSLEDSDSYGVGIIVQGFSSTGGDSTVAPTNYAENITIVGNTLVDCHMGGVSLASAKKVNISSNTIVRPGMPYLVDGATPTPSTSGNYAFGVSLVGGGSRTALVSDVLVMGNLIDDNGRGVMKSGVFDGGCTTWRSTQNIVYGSSNPYADTWSGHKSQGGTSVATGPVSITGSAQDPPGTSISITLTQPCVVTMSGCFDFSSAAAAGELLRGNIYVDGFAIGVSALFSAQAFTRRDVATIVTSTVLNAGTHTLKLSVKNNNSSATTVGHVLNAAGTGLTWTAVPTV